MVSAKRERFIISVGGSLICPPKGPDSEFLASLNNFIRSQLELHPSRQFFLVTGGGQTAREYINAGQKVIGALSPDDLDWLGIHSSRLNAHLVRTIFRDIAHPRIVKDYTVIRKVTEPVLVGAGWQPGRSTDYCSVMLAEDYHVSTVINLSNIAQVFDKDPRKFPDAKPLAAIDWPSFQKMVGDEWSPGLSMPFDPVAAKKATALGLRVVVMSGSNLQNVEDYLEDRSFIGTVIE